MLSGKRGFAPAVAELKYISFYDLKNSGLKTGLEENFCVDT